MPAPAGPSSESAGLYGAPRRRLCTLDCFRKKKRAINFVEIRLLNKKIKEIYKTFVSGHCMPFIFKNCQTAASKSKNRQFHEFF